MSSYTPEPSYLNLQWQHRAFGRHRYIPVEKDMNLPFELILTCMFCDKFQKIEWVPLDNEIMRNRNDYNFLIIIDQPLPILYSMADQVRQEKRKEVGLC